jgi:hypothetical protein
VPSHAEAVQGPFYFDPKLGRANITEGRLGAPTLQRGGKFELGRRPTLNSALYASRAMRLSYFRT